MYSLSIPVFKFDAIVDDDNSPPRNLKWVYGCVWRMLATVHKHLGAPALSSALGHLLREDVVPPEVLYCLLESMYGNTPMYIRTVYIRLSVCVCVVFLASG